MRTLRIQPLPEHQAIEEGRSIIINVEAKGNPMPLLRWYRDGKPLETTPDCKIAQFGPPVESIEDVLPEPVRMTGEMEISELFPSDGGHLVCVAENSYGRAETSLQLEVIPKRKRVLFNLCLNL